MPQHRRGRFQLRSYSNVHLSDVRELLDTFEFAYNPIVEFEYYLDDIAKISRRSPFFPDYFEFAWDRSLFGRPYLGDRFVPSIDQLVLSRVRFSSPGFWEFVGKLSPLETIRQYLSDRHERRKDRAYREPAEQRRLELENLLLENKVLQERIGIARGLGIPSERIQTEFERHCLPPLRQLGRIADGRLIRGATLSEVDESHDDESDD